MAKTKNVKQRPVPQATPVPVEVPEMDIRTMELTLVGDSPLVVHRWSEKAKREMLEKQMKKAKSAKEAKNPEQDFLDSLYWYSPRPQSATMADIKKADFGFPSIAFKAAAVDACSHVTGVTKVEARGAFHIDGDLVRIEGRPEPREDMVRIAMGTADIRYRGMFRQWRVTLRLRYNSNLLSPSQLVHLFNTAGFAIGVGEHRPQKDGSWGMFHVARDGE